MTTFGHTSHDIKQAIELMDRATQFLPYDEVYINGNEYPIRKAMIELMDTVCYYLDILEKKEEEENE